MPINIPIRTKNYYSASIDRWRTTTPESKKIRDLGNAIKLIKVETQFIKDNGYRPTVGIDYTKRLNNI